MAITIAAQGNDILDAEIPLLNNVISGSVDFKGRPSSRSKSGSWKSAAFIIGVEVAERFAYYGVVSNLITYLTGPLGQSTATATINVHVWSGTASLLPLLGAFIADSYLGRFRTIIFASLLYILGLGFLSLSAVLHSFNSSACKNTVNNKACSPSLLETTIFFFSLYLVALAQGGHKPCVQAFGADQFDDEDQEESKAKSSFFNWWYFCMCIVVIPALSLLYYIQDNLGWELGFGIPSIVMCFALIIFLLGTITYRFHVNGDGRNPFARISRVFVKAARNWQAAPTDLSAEADNRDALPHEGDQFKSVRHPSVFFQVDEESMPLNLISCNRFLEKALLAPDGSEGDEKAYGIGDVEEAKAILRLIPIWSTCLGYAVIYSQPSTLFTKQGATMDRYITSSFQIPPASLQFCVGISIIIFLPIYDRVFVPIARAISKKPSGISMLQRIGIGLFLSISSMTMAALVERKRLATAIEYGLVDLPKATIPMSVWWLAPQYVILGIADVFSLVGLQEFFYDQVSSELKSVGLALYLSIFGIGSLLSSFLTSAIEKATSGHGQDSWFSDNLNRAHLDYFYWLLAGLSAFAFAAYLYFAKSHVYNRRITV